MTHQISDLENMVMMSHSALVQELVSHDAPLRQKLGRNPCFILFYSYNLSFFKTLAVFILHFTGFSKPEGAPGMLEAAKEETSNIWKQRLELMLTLQNR